MKKAKFRLGDEVEILNVEWRDADDRIVWQGIVADFGRDWVDVISRAGRRRLEHDSVRVVNAAG